MQVKPRFESYKILETHPILKDDTGNEMCLTLFEVKLPSNKSEVIESTYTFWTVVGKNQIQWNNKAISYESIAYYRENTKEILFKGVVNNFEVEEIKDGFHNVFGNSNGVRTTFKITKQ